MSICTVILVLVIGFESKQELPSDAELYGGSVVTGAPRPQRGRTPYWMAYRDVLRAAWACGLADEYVVRLLNIPTENEDAEDIFKQKALRISRTRALEFRPLYRFQQDILTLVRSTWRTKICEHCHQPFVADKPASRFCPERYSVDPEQSCYKEHRRIKDGARLEYKRDLWRKRGKKWRAASVARRKRKRSRC